MDLAMVELRVQQIGKSRYVCLPTELLRGDPKKDLPPLDIEAGDILLATRTKAGILYEPVQRVGSIWVLMPENMIATYIPSRGNFR